MRGFIVKPKSGAQLHHGAVLRYKQAHRGGHTPHTLPAKFGKWESPFISAAVESLIPLARPHDAPVWNLCQTSDMVCYLG